MRWLSRRAETRALRLEDLVVPAERETWSGETVGPDSALRLGAVWACVRLLTETISTLPVDVYDAGSRTQVDPPALLRAPAAGLSLHDWVGQVMVSLLLRGNAYGLVVARDGLVPSQVEILSPDVVGVQVNPDGTVTYRLRGEPVDRDQLWHVRALQQPGAVVGLSPVEYARQSIGLGLAVERYGSRWFAESGQPSGVLYSDREMTSEQADTFSAKWDNARRKSKTAILGGGLKYEAISVAPDESQFVESRRLSVAEIARIFGVPPEMIGGEAGGSLTYANVEQRSLDFLTFSLGPWLARLEAALGLLLGGQHYVKFNTGALVRTDLKTRYEAHQIALTAGFLTLDEVRELEDRPPLKPSEAIA